MFFNVLLPAALIVTGTAEKQKAPNALLLHPGPLISGLKSYLTFMLWRTDAQATIVS
jgi:hypothetical protein